MRGLYAITPEEEDDDALLARAAAALTGGVKFLQYRNKTAAAAVRLRQATKLAALCRARAAAFIVNDDISLAKKTGADGVHLGQQDAPPEQARAALGANAIIGLTCHNSLAAVCAAQQAGATYIAMGALFPSPTKPSAARCPLAILSAAAAQTPLPIVAIGGITPANAASAVQAGAAAIAVCHALFAAPNIAAAARALAAPFADAARAAARHA